MSDLPASADDTTPHKPWPVSHFAHKFKGYIDRCRPTWVTGEITELKQSRSTVWLTLKDTEADILIPLKMWSNEFNNLAVKPEKGQEVVVYLKPDFWEKTGSLSMLTRDVRPVGEGEILARIEQLRALLGAEGLFNVEHKKPLPTVPQRIGLITGKDSDALKDVLQNTKRRWDAAEFEVRPVAVQGPKSASEVISALKDLDQDEDVDVIVIARGGGSLEDLMSFNDEDMVRAIFAANTPVVTAIGHEANRPIIDEVADVRASTPTDVAKHIVPDVQEELANIQLLKDRMRHILSGFHSQEEHRLHMMLDRPVLKNPWASFEMKEVEITTLKKQATTAFRNRVEREYLGLKGASAQLRALSPQHILGRGYAVVRTKNLDLVRSIEDTNVGEELIVALSDGALETTVDLIRRKDD